MRVLRVEGGRATVGGRELARPGAPIWIDCPPTPENLAWLGATFGFHPLALEDCAHEDQRPKFEQYPGSLFSVVHRLAPTPDDTAVLALEIDAFLTSEALVTFHSAPIAELDRVFDRCRLEPDLLGRGPDFVLYLLHDALTDVHFALVDALTSEIEEIADEVACHDTAADESEQLERIAAVRRAHALLRRRLAPQREVFAALARPGQQLVKDQTAIYFRDVVDHAVRLTEEIDTGRELLASAMDAYLSRTNNRLSQVTARLTLAATIFLPLNFVAGFFGMNLEILPPSVAIPLVLAAMAGMPVAMFLFFRWRRWI
jgi:magnesium transporter